MLLLLVSAAFATELNVHSADPVVVVVVVVDDTVLGQTPLERIELAPGRHDVGFRSSVLGPTVFHQSVEIPSTGAVDLFVDWGHQTVWLAASATVTPAPAPLPAPMAAPTGDLYVATDIPGARIFVDGADSGSVTPGLLQGIPAGPHLVEARTDCARANTRSEVAADVITRATLTLQSGAGAVSISATPPDSRVFLDGDELGVAPVEVQAVTCGEHTLEVRAVGHVQATRTLRVPAFETTTVDVALAIEAYGTLSIVPSPIEAAVAVDGVPVGVGPMSLSMVGAGTHSVVVTHDGYADETRQVDVAADAIARLEVTLAPEAVARRLPAARVLLNGVTTAGGLALGTAAVLTYVEAKRAYDDFLAAPTDGVAEHIFERQVAPRRTAYIAEGIGALVLLGASGALWATTDLSFTPTPGGLIVQGRF